MAGTADAYRALKTCTVALRIGTDSDANTTGRRTWLATSKRRSPNVPKSNTSEACAFVTLAPAARAQAYHAHGNAHNVPAPARVSHADVHTELQERPRRHHDVHRQADEVRGLPGRVTRGAA